MKAKNPFQDVIDHKSVLNPIRKHELIVAVLMIEISKAFKEPEGYHLKRINWLFEEANRVENL